MQTMQLIFRGGESGQGASAFMPRPRALRPVAAAALYRWHEWGRLLPRRALARLAAALLRLALHCQGRLMQNWHHDEVARAVHDAEANQRQLGEQRLRRVQAEWQRQLSEQPRQAEERLTSVQMHCIANALSCQPVALILRGRRASAMRARSDGKGYIRLAASVDSDTQSTPLCLLVQASAVAVCRQVVAQPEVRAQACLSADVPSVCTDAFVLACCSLIDPRALQAAAAQSGSFEEAVGRARKTVLVHLSTRPDVHLEAGDTVSRALAGLKRLDGAERSAGPTKPAVPRGAAR